MANGLIWIPKRLVGKLGLLNVAASAPQRFVEYCEEDYAARVRHAAAQVLQSGARVVMLTGPSSSGKTTTAHKLAGALRAAGVESAVVSLDNFFKNVQDYPRLPDGRPDYESVDALDIPAILRALTSLIETGRAAVPDFDFNREQRVRGTLEVRVDRGVAVVEGIHALNPRLVAGLPAGSVYKVYAGLREEYSHGGQRILPTRMDVRPLHAAWCGIINSAATRPSARLPCGRTCAAARTRTSRCSRAPRPTFCWTPAFLTSPAALRRWRPPCAAKCRRKAPGPKTCRACARALRCAG